MDLVRVAGPGPTPPWAGLADGGAVLRLADGMGELMHLRVADLQARCEQVRGSAAEAGEARPLPPVDGVMEVWAAGVTYLQSMEARVEESVLPSVYERVYDAERPELFFKSVPWRVVTDGEPIAVRADSPLNVPEPELAVLANRHGEVVGYTICNDVSSRSIEGENPLYLAQAKVYAGSCAIAPRVRPAWEVADPYDLAMEMRVHRGGAVAWEGSTSTSLLKRRIDELLGFLFAEQAFPDGVLLSTGTCLVPGFDFTLEPGDEVEIAITGLGSLRNPVVRGQDAMAWLEPGGGR